MNKIVHRKFLGTWRERRCWNLKISTKLASSIRNSKNIYERMAKRKEVPLPPPASWRFPFNPRKFARLTLFTYISILGIMFQPSSTFSFCKNCNCAWWKKGLRELVYLEARLEKNLRGRVASFRIYVFELWAKFLTCS